MSKSTYKNYIKLVIILGIIAYIIMFVYTFFVQDIETVVLESGRVEETNTTDGIITRTEEVVTLNVKDDLHPLVSSGERVSKGQALAVIRDENIKIIENDMDKLNENLEIISQPEAFNSEIKVLDTKTNNFLNQIIKSGGYRSFETMMKDKEEINQVLQTKIYKIGELTTDNNVVNNYISKMNEYKQKLSAATNTIKSTMAGTVVYKLDGYEKILTNSRISSYTPEILESFNISRGELIGTSKENSFKIVDNLECYVTVVLDTEEADNAYVDQKVYLRFPEIDNSLEISGVVDYINFAPTGNVITFKINRAIEKILNYRKTKVEIVWDSEEGYKVPVDAILKSETGDKIYLYLGRNYVVEKNVEIKKEHDGYAIINGVNGDKLYLYDSVILDICNVNLNKMLKY